MGFATQLSVLESRQQELVNVVKEQEQVIQKLNRRIEELENVNEVANGYRREVVNGFRLLLPVHTEASSAFQQRVSSIQDEDVEGMLIAWGTMMSTVA
jgi:hypothetical protein